MLFAYHNINVVKGFAFQNLEPKVKIKYIKNKFRKMRNQFFIIAAVLLNRCRFQFVGLQQTIKNFFCFKVQNFFIVLGIYSKAKKVEKLIW